MNGELDTVGVVDTHHHGPLIQLVYFAITEEVRQNLVFAASKTEYHGEYECRISAIVA